MHLPEILPHLKSKVAVTKVAGACLSAESVSELIAYLPHPKLGPKAAWVLSHVLYEKPALGQSHQNSLLQIVETTTHSAVARCILRYLQSASLTQENQVFACELAMAYLEDPAQPVAPKAFAMKVAWRFSNAPQKANLVEMIKEQLPQASAGFRSCARKILENYQVIQEKEN